MATAAQTTAPVTTGKLTTRSITKEGKLYFGITLADGKVVSSVMTQEQVGMANLLGASVPKVGADVSFSYNVNTLNGIVSEEWVTLNL